MSSPFSNLKRPTKAPLPGYIRKFQLPSYPETEEKETEHLLEEVATDIANRRCHSQENLPEKLKLPQTSVLSKAPNISTIQPQKTDHLLKEVSSNDASRRCHSQDNLPEKLHLPCTSKSSSVLPLAPNKSETQPLKEAPSDKELMSLMMGRISALEAKVYSQNKELIQKSRTVSQLEEKLRILQQQNDETSSPAEMVKLLKIQCVMLQKQVQEMEDFLYDYGLIWVGEANAGNENLDCATSRGSNENHVWKPGESVVSSLPEVDYDIVIQKIKELNVLVGDGVTQVEHTKDGARLKYPDPVQLTLYKNGILMFDGPFRPLTDPMTRHCLYDIMEGYFPSELQAKYPDGVPFKVTDKREVYYEDTRYHECFPGVGKTLSNKDEESDSGLENILQASTLKISDQRNKVVNERPGPALSVNQFVERLPPCVIKNGRVIDIRQSLWSRLKGDTSETQVSIVDTEATQEMKQRLQNVHLQRQEIPESVATLRVKSENGEHTYVLKMKPHETIGDLRRYLDKQRDSDNSPAYQILSTFPRKVLSDDIATIQDCGLTPSATLHLRPLTPKT